MTPEREHKIFQLGCFTVLIGLVALSVSAFFIDSKFWIAFVILILVWLIICNIRFKNRRTRDSEILDALFASMGITKPYIKYSSGYGFTRFTLTFPSEQDMRNAKERGLIESFHIAIQNAYQHTGSNQRPFDAKMAISTTYE